MTGLLFLHRISDSRITGSPVRNKHMFERLFGIGALQNIILVTTMWDTVDALTGLEREKELRANFWKPMIAFGSLVARFDCTYQSAWNIVDQLTNVRRPLRLQVEIVDEGKPLAQTAAGVVLFQWLNDLIARFRAIIGELRRRLSHIPRGPVVVAELTSEELALQENLNQVREQRNILANRPSRRSHHSLANLSRVTMASRASPPISSYRSASSTSAISLQQSLVSSEDDYRATPLHSGHARMGMNLRVRL